MRHFIMIVVLSVFVFSQTSAQSALDTLDPSGQVVVYWHEWDGPQLDAMREVVSTFNRENPHGITVQLVSKSSGGRLLRELAAPDPAEALPNVVGGIFPSSVRGLLKDGLVIGLDTYVTHPIWGVSAEDLGGIGVGIRGSFQDDMRQGAWPLGLSLNALAVNPVMLNSLGAQDLPVTLDDMTRWACAAAQTSTGRGETVNGLSVTLTLGDFEGLVAAQGRRLYDETTGNFRFNSAESQTVLRWLQTLQTQGCAYDAGGSYDDTRDFAYGLTPFAFTSTAGLPFIEADILDSVSGVSDWVFMPIPGSQPTVQIYLRGVAAVPSSSAEAQLASWLFVRYLTTPQAQTLWAQGLSYQPVNSAAYALLGEDFLTANPTYVSALTLLRRADVTPFLTSPAVGYSEIEEEVYEPLLEAILAGEDVGVTAAEAERTAAEVVIEAVRAANE